MFNNSIMYLKMTLKLNFYEKNNRDIVVNSELDTFQRVF